MGKAFFPLDQKLKLRQDSWSEGAARVATRMAICAPSYDQAAVDYADATGGSMSATSIWRVTNQSGELLARAKAAEAARVSAPAHRGERAPEKRVAQVDGLEGMANLSTDGGMIHLRHEGWKEVKISTISAVEWETTLSGEERIRLSRTSHVARLDNADAFAPYQYAEGLRRGLNRVQTLASVNDGASWIERITQTNFPQAIQIVDWYHAKHRLIQVAQAVWGTGQRAHQWVDQRLSQLRQGQVAKVIAALRPLPLATKEDQVRTSPGYFEDNRSRMRYHHFRRQRLPIGSGSVESAVDQVVQHRLHRPGRGWNRQQASGLLALLGEYHSGRFGHAWQLLAARSA